MHMVMFVLNNPDLLDDLLDAWRALGVSGVTLVESSGSYRRRAYLLGTRFVHEGTLLTQRIEEGHFTLFTVVPNEAAVHQCLSATETIVGDLEQPETGIFTSWALGLTKGVPPTLRPDGNWGENPA